MIPPGRSSRVRCARSTVCAAAACERSWEARTSDTRGLVRGAALSLLLVWAWPTGTTLKLASSSFMLPMAMVAAYGAGRAIRGLRETVMMEGS